MRTLFMHVGLPKTGTTAIQHFLQDNRATLTAHGVHELKAFGLGNAWKIAAYSESKDGFRYFAQINSRIPASTGAVEREAFWDEVRAEMKTIGSDATVVASSEFIYGFINTTDLMRQLQDRFAEFFDRVVVIAFVRDQVPAFKSYFAQCVRGTLHENRPFDQFVRSFPDDHHLFNYSVGLGRWADVFGDENVLPGIFNPKEVLSTYRGMIGLDQDFANSLVTRDRRSNKTPGFRTIEMVRKINGAWGSAPVLRPAFDMARYLATRGPFDLGGNLPGSEDGYIRDTFSPSNIDFGSRFFARPVDPFA